MAVMVVMIFMLVLIFVCVLFMTAKYKFHILLLNFYRIEHFIHPT